MLTIGIIGGIASGKSTVARLLEGRGVRVVNADLVAHETYALGTPGYEAVMAAFGPSILDAGGAIDRRALGRLVFAGPSLMARLTAIVWPLTRQRLEARLRAAEAEGVDLLALEATVLHEAGWRDLVDEVWLVRAPVTALRARLLERGLTAEEAEMRLAAQPSATGAADVDVVIDNDGDLESLRAKVDAALRAVLERRRE